MRTQLHELEINKSTGWINTYYYEIRSIENYVVNVDKMEHVGEG